MIVIAHQHPPVNSPFGPPGKPDRDNLAMPACVCDDVMVTRAPADRLAPSRLLLAEAWREEVVRSRS